MLKRLAAALLIGLSPFSAAADTVSDRMMLWQNQGPPVLRGTVIRQRQMIPELDRDGDLGPVGTQIGPVYTQADFDRMAAVGINLVVLSHPGIYRSRPPYKLDNAVADNLDKLMDYAEAADMFVVIEPRTGPGRSEFTHLLDEVGTWFDDDQLDDSLWTSDVAKRRYVEMMRVTAVRYQRHRALAGIATMAAPNSNITGDDALAAPLMVDDPAAFDAEFTNSPFDWNLLQKDIVAGIRQLDKDVPILLAPNGEGDLSWLPWMEIPEDDRIVLGARIVSADADFLALDAGSYGAVPKAITTTQVKRWMPDGQNLMEARLLGLEQRGIPYAIGLWQSDWAPFAELRHETAFRFGSDPDTRQAVADSPLMKLYHRYWARNRIRPSQLARGYR